MNHSKRLLKIAEKILADVHFSTQQEFDEYLKNHPNYREDTKFYVNGVQVKAPPKQKKNNDSSEMTEEQKKLHDMMEHPKSFDDLTIVAGHTDAHPTTLDILADKAERTLKQENLSNQAYNKTFMVLTRISENQNASEKTLNRVVYSASAYEDVDKYSAYSRKDSLIGSAVKHPNVSKDIMYAFYKDYPVHAASNPNCPTDILEELSLNEGDFVRLCVLENPNTSKQTREKLSKDKKVMELYKEDMAQRSSVRL